MSDIQLYLVSHTNTGKTSLVRTMLGQDVGVVEDEANVTRTPSVFELASLSDVGTVGLWDTPGFADSFRLARRLRIKSRWWRWLAGCWDRLFNHRLWGSCILARTLKNEAHVILYLINVLERPMDAIYFKPELEALSWVGKPVIAILNQGGNQLVTQMPTAASTKLDTKVEHANAGLWREALHEFAVVKKTLALDSFSRCWLQELDLFDEITSVLPEGVQDDYRKLSVTLREGHFERFEKSVEELSKTLTILAQDQVRLDSEQLTPLKRWWQRLKNKLPWRRAKPSPIEAATQQLAARFLHETRSVTNQLIAINRLTGTSAGEIVASISGISINAPPDQSTAGLSGAMSGALVGLGTDLAVGGASLGAGALIGAALGGLGGVAIAGGYRTRTDHHETILSWSKSSLNEAFSKFVLLYLSIAHFGRGQGQWLRKTDPENWQILVKEEVARQDVRLTDLWESLSLKTADTATEAECAALLREVVVTVLLKLYPGSSKHLQAR